jgi:hypothetical protein
MYTNSIKIGPSIRHRSPPREVRRRRSRLGIAGVVVEGDASGRHSGARASEEPTSCAHLWDLPPRALLQDPSPLLPKPTAPRATAITTGPRVRRHRLSGLGAPSVLARPP